MRDIQVSDVLHVRELSKRVKMLEVVDGGGKTQNIKSAVCTQNKGEYNYDK